MYGLLRYGVQMLTAAGAKTQTVDLIDWKHPEANDFAIAEEVTLNIGYQPIVEPSRVPQADGTYEKATGASDLYALGIILFEMLAGQMFDRALRKMINAFEERAAQLYGAGGAGSSGGDTSAPGISSSSATSAA